MSAEGVEPVSGFEFFARDPELIQHLDHPMRMRVYREAVRRPVSAKDLSVLFEQPLARISYHVRSLADVGLLRPVRRTQRRGAVETHYRGVALLDFDDESLRTLPESVRRSLWATPIRLMAEDMLRAVDEGANDEPDAFITRAHFVVTAAGRQRLQEEVLELYERLRRLERELSAQAAEATERGEETYELNVVLCEYRGERRQDRNAPYMINWDREGVPTPETIPPDLPQD